MLMDIIGPDEHPFNHLALRAVDSTDCGDSQTYQVVWQTVEVQPELRN